MNDRRDLDSRAAGNLVRAQCLAGTDHPHKTPAVLRVSPFGQTEIEFSKPGFTTRVVKLGPFGDDTDAADDAALAEKLWDVSEKIVAEVT